MPPVDTRYVRYQCFDQSVLVAYHVLFEGVAFEGLYHVYFLTLNDNQRVASIF